MTKIAAGGGGGRLGAPVASGATPRLTKENPVQRTLVLVKPDGVRRGLAGEVISRLEQKGLTLVAMELRTLERATAEEHYGEHRERPFFGELVEFITGGPLVALVVEGPNAVAGTRRLMGVTNPVEATPGSIRGDYALEIGQNLVHGSDSEESAKREIGIFFPNL
jgi:nucleoside-diphosphate kinase